jgi:RAB6A-GEF complex partner protein 2
MRSSHQRAPSSQSKHGEIALHNCRLPAGRKLMRTGREMSIHHRKDSTSTLHPPDRLERLSSISSSTNGSHDPVSAPKSRRESINRRFQDDRQRIDEVHIASPAEEEKPGGQRSTLNLEQASERSSADFYSLSNHSQDTLMSEQPSVMSEQPSWNYSAPTPRHPPSRQLQKPRAVILLMGYAQIGATFTLDASLVNQSHFEEVKSKGFLGGQAGGGVVGVKKPRPGSGFLGNFNLNTISGSINSLISGDNMSSVSEMKSVANSRAIPLLSTPQSLLFVNMHLEPGEEQSYEYIFPMPRGLPSSHRGKAIRISHTLTIGVQGLPGSRDMHAVRQVSVPVRVFPGVSHDGEVYGHDLMQPHVILRDLAQTKPLHNAEHSHEAGAVAPEPTSMGEAKFLQFVDSLLDRNHRRQSSSGTMDAFLSPQDTSDKSKALQAIDRAIMFSNTQSDGDASPNRFDIARNGQRVAVIVLDRPLHRLGETITSTIDFSDGQVPCASLKMTLETTEKVTPSLALRSLTTISRMTRKVYAARSENVLFCRRATFAPSIPTTATPTFVTSAINLDWSLRFDFGTVKPAENENGELVSVTNCLEEVVRDDRGTINVAMEHLDCENFEVIIPITVYGDLVPEGKEGDEVVGIPI